MDILGGSSTDELITKYAAACEIPREDLERAIPVAIDAIYRARNRYRTVHEAGAAAAVAALLATR